MNNNTNIRIQTIKYSILGSLVFGIFMLSQIAVTREKAPTTYNPEAYKQLLDANERIQNKTIDSILEDRLRSVNTLIEIVDQANSGKISKSAGNAAAYLLGKMRAPEAVPVLAIALEKVDINSLKIIVGIDPLVDAAWNALVGIGRPSIPAMIMNITTSDNQLLRIHSMDVINLILGGKDNLIGLLNRLMEQKERNQQEKDRLKKSLEWAQSYYKETTIPLY